MCSQDGWILAKFSFALWNETKWTWTSAKFYRGIKTSNSKREISLHLALSGSQSQHRIRCILSAHGAAGHIIMQRNKLLICDH